MPFHLRVSYKLYNNGLSHTFKSQSPECKFLFILLTHPKCKIDFTTKHECEAKEQTAGSRRLL